MLVVRCSVERFAVELPGMSVVRRPGKRRVDRLKDFSEVQDEDGDSWEGCTR